MLKVSMTLDQLETFVAIAKEGGLRAAAKVLHKTQPTLSLSMKNLEEELRVTLLDRDSYRVKLTETGEALFLKAQEILTKDLEFKALASELKGGKESKLKIVIDYLCPVNFLLKILNQYAQKCSHTKIELDFAILNGSEQKLRAGEANIAITPFIAHHSEVEFQKICDLNISPVISKKIFSSQKISREEFFKIPQIIVKNPDQLKNKSEFGTFKGATQWQVSDHFIKKELILNGFGWGHLEHSSIAKELRTQKLIPLSQFGLEQKTLPLYQARSFTHAFGPVATDLWNFIASQF